MAKRAKKTKKIGRPKGAMSEATVVRALKRAEVLARRRERQAKGVTIVLVAVDDKNRDSHTLALSLTGNGKIDRDLLSMLGHDMYLKITEARRGKK